MNLPAPIDRASLPTEVAPLQDLVLELGQQMQAMRAQFDAQLDTLRHQLVELRRRLFGPRSEVISDPPRAGRTVVRPGTDPRTE